MNYVCNYVFFQESQGLVFETPRENNNFYFLGAFFPPFVPEFDAKHLNEFFLGALFPPLDPVLAAAINLSLIIR